MRTQAIVGQKVDPLPQQRGESLQGADVEQRGIVRKGHQQVDVGSGPSSPRATEPNSHVAEAVLGSEVDDFAPALASMLPRSLAGKNRNKRATSGWLRFTRGRSRLTHACRRAASDRARELARASTRGQPPELRRETPRPAAHRAQLLTDDVAIATLSVWT